MTSSTTPKTVLLKGCPKGVEAPAGGAITPGMLLALGTDGAVVAHATTSAVKVPAYFARELEFAGGGLDTAYETGETVPFWHCQPGDEVFALLENGANVAVGALLASNAAGALEAAGANYVVAQALEAVNNASGANARIRVRIV